MAWPKTENARIRNFGLTTFVRCTRFSRSRTRCSSAAVRSVTAAGACSCIFVSQVSAARNRSGRWQFHDRHPEILDRPHDADERIHADRLVDETIGVAVVRPEHVLILG